MSHRQATYRWLGAQIGVGEHVPVEDIRVLHVVGGFTAFADIDGRERAVIYELAQASAWWNPEGDLSWPQATGWSRQLGVPLWDGLDLEQVLVLVRQARQRLITLSCESPFAVMEAAPTDMDQVVSWLDAGRSDLVDEVGVRRWRPDEVGW